MKVVWENDREMKPRRKSVSLYWLYISQGMKRKYVCSFLLKADAEDTRRHMGRGWKLAKRPARRQICP